MSAFKTDGTFTTAAIHGAARFSCPIEGDTTTTQFEQDYLVAISSYSPLAVGTAHGTNTTHYLLRESPIEDRGGGIGQFTRTYCKVPVDRSEWESFAYNFIGYWIPPSQGGIGSIGRDRFTQTVMSRLDYTYALGTPPAVIEAQQYTVLGYPNLKLDYLQFNSNINDSDPSVEDYELLSAGTDGTNIFVAGTGIVAEDSRVTRWAGNIYERVTRYVIPL
jgi:hypothetical protein